MIKEKKGRVVQSHRIKILLVVVLPVVHQKTGGSKNLVMIGRNTSSVVFLLTVEKNTIKDAGDQEVLLPLLQIHHQVQVQRERRRKNIKRKNIRKKKRKKRARKQGRLVDQFSYQSL
ncbi:uncharacterized protein LOC102801137 isoform X2 [Saccoglossus kowalevskii]|uniref:Uncharacterized protein LOC102801137 isoform X2 n=1 Tax=Saccoglossus kowalevskii TaxID=10224 RepID=A0ABM0LV00_SACKO|nr:PREDICTED: uncharacterized protein LOC102801137 isoform X2 [Saccoglossus kowalevskii]